MAVMWIHMVGIKPIYSEIDKISRVADSKQEKQSADGVFQNACSGSVVPLLCPKSGGSIPFSSPTLPETNFLLCF